MACRFTEADLRMYPTIIRYDGCYTTLFKCCKKRILDYPHLSAWLADVHQLTVKDSPSLQVAVPFPCMSAFSACKSSKQQRKTDGAFITLIYSPVLTRSKPQYQQEPSRGQHT